MPIFSSKLNSFVNRNIVFVFSSVVKLDDFLNNFQGKHQIMFVVI